MKYDFRFTPEDYPIEDCDKKARLQRAIEIAEGVEPPPGFISTSSLQSLHSMSNTNLQLLPNANDASLIPNGKMAASKSHVNAQHWHMVCSNSSLRFMLPSILQHADEIPRIHSQVRFID